MIYCDTSLVVAVLAREPSSYRAQDWIALLDTAELCISDWVVTEFSGALALKARTGQISPELVKPCLTMSSTIGCAPSSSGWLAGVMLHAMMAGTSRSLAMCSL